MTVAYAGGSRLGFGLTFISSFPTASFLHLNLLATVPARRNYSTKLPAQAPGPVKYVNADVDKVQILTENRDKSGVYM